MAPRCFLTRRNADRATDSGVAEGEVGGGGRDGGRAVVQMVKEVAAHLFVHQ